MLNATPDYDRNGKYYEANLVASWEIDVFGGLRRGREAAQAEYQASASRRGSAARLAVAAQTADTYVTIRGLQARSRSPSSRSETRQQSRRYRQAAVRQGARRRAQMKQAEGAVAQVAANVPVLETSLEAAMNALDVLLGAQPGTHRAESKQMRRFRLLPGSAADRFARPSCCGAGPT